MKNIERKNHPRPQFVRENWISLDGEWQFAFDDENQGLKNKWYQGLKNSQLIQVPFTYETELSGIHDSEHHYVVWYQKNFEVNELENLVLNFEGVDYRCQVWLNGECIGSHQGAYERFSFDLESYLVAGENTIIVRVEDSLACEQPRGKQRWLKDNFGCWYVQTTGIWKSVWLEEAASQRLRRVKLTPDLDNDQIIIEPVLQDNAVRLETKPYEIAFEISYEGQFVRSYQGSLTHEMTPIVLDTRITEDACWGTKVWSPETPRLYDLTCRLYDAENQLIDEVYSYFGMRKIAIEQGQILLNNRQLYQRLILDQGYWQESGITPPSVKDLEVDVDRILEMGYNGVRKHQKIEDERFLYLCDSKGLLVWSEMAATYNFNDLAITNFTEEWLKIVEQNYNHPSIITWVPFNESWGIKDIDRNRQQQHFTESIYHLTKAFDTQRPVITNDGWVHTISDIITLHDYEELGEVFATRYQDKDSLMNNQQQFNNDFYALAEGYAYRGQPIIISEFGGIAFSSESGWGYGNQVQNEEVFMKRFDSIHKAIQKLPYSVGYCYTQLTDVEQEINGLLDVNRQAKVDLNKVREINLRRLK
ncbi:beta-galactosidase/beta-glucuronidase [Enterococcus sp. PF1-24]|uniref:glycoside hydrolase family 2 protein n=1 Tax=unclassified Enterococcus TaxID=2608891 RepID=UPI002474634B|nr:MULTISPECIES: sugar-binding domain-containing protein [unclassified Enterococcus]MDH6365732.1 beta-galactosidase/beta-glucuronidase [Enterococcus sp. PFB1-1]MDH6402827.1 beta-galactosidase/beta-glucuronidase [Enterococcus sp. PF1-24]